MNLETAICLYIYARDDNSSLFAVGNNVDPVDLTHHKGYENRERYTESQIIDFSSVQKKEGLFPLITMYYSYHQVLNTSLKRKNSCIFLRLHYFFLLRNAKTFIRI